MSDTTDKMGLPSDPQELRELTERLEYTGEEPPVVPPPLAPDATVKVPTSIKLPSDLYLAVDEEARQLGSGAAR